MHKGHMTWSNSVKKGETGTLNTGETCMRLYPLTGFTAAPSVLTLAVPVIQAGSLPLCLASLFQHKLLDFVALRPTGFVFLQEAA